MNNEIPKWLNDLDRLVVGMTFGEVDVRITRHRSKTSKVTYSKDYKLVPKTTDEAISDIEKLLNNLLNSDFDGELQFAIDIKGGTIKMLTIKNKETKNYGASI